MNELKVIYDAMGIDVWEVIEGAATKPFGYMPFYPGPGLGGHCIPIDPFYLTWKSREYGLTTRFIELAGEVNVGMPKYVVAKLEQALDRQQKVSLKGLEACNVVVVATDHDAVDYDLVSKHAKLIVDTRNVFSRKGLAAPMLVKA